MPENVSSGLINPRLATRNKMSGRSFDGIRRPVQPHIRRGVDGFAIQAPVPTHTAQPASTHQPLTPRLPMQRSPRLTQDIRPAMPRQTRSHVLKRPPVQTKVRRQRRRRTKQNPISFLLVSMAMVIFMGGAVVSYLGWKTTQKSGEQVEVLASTTSHEGTDVAIEDEITTDMLMSYRVAPDMPRFLKIPRLNVDARVKRVHMKSNGILAAPTHVYDAGWFDGSAKPGENGAVLINGHVHGSTKPGIFYRLNNLKQGDTVEVERGDGKIFTYQVVTTESIDNEKLDMQKLSTPIEPGKQGLNIVTSTGRYDIKTNKYEQRLVVYLVHQ